MKFEQIYDAQAQFDCAYRVHVEIGIDEFMQVSGDGYSGYDERWVMAWFYASIIIQDVERITDLRHTINDFFDY